jgi:cysteine synthase
MIQVRKFYCYSGPIFSCNMRGQKAIIMPDDIAEEKVKALRALGANVQRVRPVSIVDKKQVRN